MLLFGAATGLTCLSQLQLDLSYFFLGEGADAAQEVEGGKCFLLRVHFDRLQILVDC